mgnify:CR=1 FL=1
MNVSSPSGLRLCVVTRGDLWPTNHGAAVRIVRAAQYASLLGAEVYIVTDDRDRYWRYVQGHRQELPYGTRFRAMQEWPGMNAAGRLAERICGRVGYPGEETFLYRPQFDPQWWARVGYVGLRHDIDVFQAEFPGYGLACWLAAKALEARSSIVQHNVEWDRLQDVMGLSATEVERIRALELFALNKVDDVLAVSTDDRDRMVQAGVATDRITVLPHGVDTLSYAQAGRGRLLRWSRGHDEGPLLFFHGTLHYWPNTQAVAFIAEQLMPRLEHIPGLRIWVAGMNPPTYYQHDRIDFLGPVDDLPAHIDAADVCLCPVPSGGGTRMKLLEYFAAGKAVVSTTKGAEGIPYTDAEIAIADTADAFADAVVRLLESDTERQAMGDAAQRFARGYDWTPVMQATLDLYTSGQGRGGVYARRPDAPIVQPPRSVDPVEAHLPAREPSKPRTLLLLINRGCNLRCSFCDLWDNAESMPLERAIGLLDEALLIDTKTLVITGGEPFAYKPLFQLVRAAKERGLAVNITTNGTLIEKRWDELIDSGVNSLSISIDGLEATHEALRGVPGCFESTLAGARRARAAGIPMSVYCTVTNQNVGELIQVHALATELGAKFDFWPVNDAEELYLKTEGDKQAWNEAVAHIAGTDAAMNERRLFDTEALQYHGGGIGVVRCLGLVDQYGVTFRGDLLPCCVWGGESLKVGNVFETPLSELWHSDAVQAHRQGLYHQGCAEDCFNHSLYEFTRSTKEPFTVPGT